MRIWIFFALISIPLWGAVPKTNPQIAAFLEAWGKTTSFEADFKQTITYPKIGETETNQGHVWIIKPGKLRWDEENRSQKLSQILNGKKLTLITERVRNPGPRTIDVWKDGLSMIDKAAFGFLSEEKPLDKAYVLSIEKDSKNKLWLKLKTRTGNKDPLVAEISKSSYVLDALSTETPESKVEIVFSNIKTSEEIDSKVFEWTEKKGKDRVHEH